MEKDLQALKNIGYETYNDTFRSMNTAETMKKYLDEAFCEETLLSEMNTPGTTFYFLYRGNTLVGYLKLNEAPAQSDMNDPDSLEIERIYVRKKYKGNGFGKELMNYALHKALEQEKKYIWLGVWERNQDAIAFYTKMGFQISGTHSFTMGDEQQSDYIMKKWLVP